ncbi:MAG: dephospho-CoA kinase [Planctomycetes bacterium]|jgi:dephospho-CoA kinase|nr:dephospho-CoA kinase [Planctomycetota bacterium]
MSGYLSSDRTTSGGESPRAVGSRVWGVLGGIASGKSTAARLLAGDLGVVLDADEIVDRLYGEPEFQSRVAEAFGPGVLGAEGRVDRQKLAGAVFADPTARALLESWIHPAVRAELVARYQDARRRGVPRIVLDVPLLLENDHSHGLAGLCDALIFVDTPDSLRDQRAVRSRGWKSGEVARREALQMPLTEKRALAHHVLHNDGDPQHLAALVRETLRRLESASL